MGNPLLDISAKVDAEFLKKYGLEPENAILADAEKHGPLYTELSAMEGVEFIAGGATQNSIRVAQWMLQEKGATSYMGSVGKDDYAKKMTDCCEKDGLNVLYMEDEAATGTCAVCVVGVGRSLCANLSAANNYKVDHMKENWAVVEKAQVYYSAGFFVTVSPESIEAVCKHSSENNKTYCFNLAAPFLMEVPPFKKVIEDTLPYVDFLFGNETECATFAKCWGFEETDLKEIAKKMSMLPKEGSKPRTVVITQGTEETIVACKGEVQTFAVVALPTEKVVDTNGAGDAYVGGFLSGLCAGAEVEECCKRGAYAASEIVQQSGCQYPEKPDFK